MNRDLLVLLLILLAGSTWAWQSTHAELSATRMELSSLKASLSGADTIVDVSDGDTIKLERAGKVRLLDIDTPEIWERTEKGGWRRKSDPDPRAIAAMEYLQSLIGRDVSVRIQARDHYGRTLAHVHLLPDGTNLSEEISRRGWSQ